MPLAPANDDQYSVQPQPVRVLCLNKGAHKVRRPGAAGKPDELWFGTAWDDSLPEHADLPVYVRICGLRPAAAELVCAVVGRAIGLPVPEPFLIRIARGTLPRSRLLDPKAQQCLAFGCHDVGGATFAQLLRADSDATLMLLLSWKHLVPVATFDEWMANPDRNFGNILFVAGSLWLIDHAEALGGVQADLYPLAELTDASFSNRLAGLLEPLQNPQRVVALERAREWIANPAGALDLGAALACTGINPWHSKAEQDGLLDFVRERLTLTHALLCQRLGHPQLPLNSQATAARAAGAESSRSGRASRPPKS